MARAPVKSKTSHNGKKPKALAPKTGKAKPDEKRPTSFLYTPRQTAGVRVNEDTSLTLGAVWACVKVISEDIAGLPWDVKEKRSDGGSDEVPEDPAAWLIGTQANPETPAFQFREILLAWALTWGNGYAEIERDLAGRPVWLWPITPDRVEPKRTLSGTMVYEVRNPYPQSPTIVPMEDMFHLRGLGFDGLAGYSVIQLAARSIGTGIALDQSTSDIFGNDSTPGGMLKHPSRLSREARTNLVTSWERRHSGPGNRRRVAILEEGLDWVQTGLPPDDTKLIEQRQFTPADICRWFRVSPVKIQDLLRATFSNIEELAIWHTTDALLPWVRRLETEANIKLFGRTNRGKRFTKLNLNGQLRGKMAERWTAYTQAMDRGVMSINDVLALEDRNPIGPDGDKRFVPLNMQLLEKAGEEPPQPTQPTQPATKPTDPNANPSQSDTNPPQDNKQMRAALQPVFEDAFRRLLLREVDRTKSALSKTNGEFAAWLAKVETEHFAYTRDIFRPAVEAMSIVRGVGSELLEAALACVAARHLEDFKARLVLAASNPAAVEEWGGLSSGMATELIVQLVAALETMK